MIFAKIFSVNSGLSLEFVNFWFMVVIRSPDTSFSSFENSSRSSQAMFVSKFISTLLMLFRIFCTSYFLTNVALLYSLFGAFLKFACMVFKMA